LFRRDKEFIGYHGTNSNNAAFYKTNGISKPDVPNGADAELGFGMYISDDTTVANFYAQSSANNFNNKNANKVTPKICTIFASDSSQWRRLVPKLFVPAGLLGNGAAFVKKQADLAVLLKVAPSEESATANVVNFSVLNKDELVRAGLKGKTGNQLALPAAQQSKFELGDCFDPTDPVLPANGDFPTFNYQSLTPSTEWNIPGCIA